MGDLKSRLEINKGRRHEARYEWYKVAKKVSTKSEGLKKEIKTIQATVDCAAEVPL